MYHTNAVAVARWWRCGGEPMTMTPKLACGSGGGGSTKARAERVM